uniref:Uncharacterized protein n=2 Tax=Arundo donax TaxID=35708 RepID=A0A0A9DK14_ARUDO
MLEMHMCYIDTSSACSPRILIFSMPWTSMKTHSCGMFSGQMQEVELHMNLSRML